MAITRLTRISDGADQPGHDRSRQEEDLHRDAGQAQDEEQDLEPAGRAAEKVAPEQEQEACRGDQPADAMAGRHGFHVQPGQADDQEQAGDQPPVKELHGDIDAGGLDDVQFASPYRLASSSRLRTRASASPTSAAS